MATVIPVILSGGSGSRLWPKSRHHYPKQLHQLYGDKTMLQQTVCRVKHLNAAPIIICNNHQRFMVADQLQEIQCDSEIILEPVARNTAPAIVVAALRAMQADTNAVIAVFPADHLVNNSDVFNAALDTAVGAAEAGALVTFGVVPTKPEVGYGYIKSLGKGAAGSAAQNITAFVEKPNLSTAQTYCDSGDYFWNSGMFVFSAAQLIEELKNFEPEMVAHCEAALARAKTDLDFIRLSEQEFALCPDISIDYALMEKTSNAKMVALNAGWSDVGSWEALWEVSEKDEHNNVLVGDAMVYGSKNCYAASEGRLVALVGVEDLVVVETADSVLVMDKNRSQDVKHIVTELKRLKRSEFESHREVFRPWGSYDLVDCGERYQVKRITVKPGHSLSLQMHHHRAEHWVVVTGTAEVQREDSTQILSENQSVYIPIGQKHRLANPGLVPLQLIEVASGGYLAEDDIVRFTDT